MLAALSEVKRASAALADSAVESHISATMIGTLRKLLPIEPIRDTEHLIRGLNDLGVQFEAALRQHQIYELIAHLYVGILDKSLFQHSQTGFAGSADLRIAGLSGRNV
jgi:hypothetical protein